MKITVCGKGGCGKSTVTTLLAKELARMGKKVLVVDSDESNFGLHRQLGVELPRDFTEYFGGKDKAFKTMMTSGILDSMKLSAFAKKFFRAAFGFLDNGRKIFKLFIYLICRQRTIFKVHGIIRAFNLAEFKSGIGHVLNFHIICHSGGKTRLEILI